MRLLPYPLCVGHSVDQARQLPYRLDLLVSVLVIVKNMDKTISQLNKADYLWFA
jgi:hypothetical protein